MSSIKEEYGTQYGNGTFYISDDGTSNNQFYVFRALYLNNEKYTEGKEQLHVGDEVVVYGSVTNYMGNTPETVQGDAYLYSLKCNYTGGGDEPVVVRLERGGDEVAHRGVVLHDQYGHFTHAVSPPRAAA